ncbi:MAG: sigma 54-interacting transcriptional regulator [Deltaproteobacteria bacterium]|nr:sigma 54-interacting transcriptional regulator [Deltaproteobacteria bacterium]
MSQEKTPALIRRDTSAEAVKSRRALALIVVFSNDAKIVGQVTTFMNQVTAGRKQEGDVQLAIDDRMLSRRHFTVRTTQQGAEIEDLGSTNGTYVGGRRITKEPISSGSVIRVGETLLAFEEVSSPLHKDAADELVGNALPMQLLRVDIERVAKTDLPALILGETGTGKELVARRLHELSGRSGEFVAVNCGAVPSQLAEATFFGHKRGAFTGATSDAPGHWLAAHEGTLFLDEIGELPMELQPKILRVLDSCEFLPVGGSAIVKSSARVVAATNVDLAARVAEGRFRQDLYARLAVYILRPPPLRERRSDIVALFELWLKRAAPAKSFALDAELVERMLLHPWPMNVRELRNLAQRLSLSDQATLTPAELPPEWATQDKPKSAPAPIGLKELPSREQLDALLQWHGGNVAAIATAIGKDRKQVYRWLKKYNLLPEGYRKDDE